ncbi:MAG: DbpA RNA binding domain-containing protein, partial [Candidatus Cloacimonetes bacterium]|nr:DbpA RNA binding domain-containing protein [Candidatus Cloacimonadota bacterium]
RDLMRYINQLKVARSLEIGQIDIMTDHCLVELDAEYEDKILKAVSRFNYKGVPVLAEVVSPARRTRYEPRKENKNRDYEKVRVKKYPRK